MTLSQTLQLAVLIAFGTWLPSALADPCKHDEHNFRCVKVLRNYDADTITVEVPNVHPLIGSKIGVRVAGIDTPEMKGKNSCEKSKAAEAQRYVAELLRKAKRVDLVDVRREKYFRILAEVMIDGESLSEKLLERGYAYPYDGGTKAKVNWCAPQRLPASRGKREPREASGTAPLSGP